MDDTLCPRCGGKVEVQASDVTMYPQCIGDCGWSPVVLGSDLGWPDDEDILRADVLSSVHHLAHWEPRDRLPTPEEDAAHAARHGDAAGWMANQGMGWRSVDDAAEMEILRGFVGESWRSYPHVNGRPVGWPEVDHG